MAVSDSRLAGILAAVAAFAGSLAAAAQAGSLTGPSYLVALVAAVAAFGAAAGVAPAWRRPVPPSSAGGSHALVRRRFARSSRPR